MIAFRLSFRDLIDQMPASLHSPYDVPGYLDVTMSARHRLRLTLHYPDGAEPTTDHRIDHGICIGLGRFSQRLIFMEFDFAVHNRREIVKPHVWRTLRNQCALVWEVAERHAREMSDQHAMDYHMSTVRRFFEAREPSMRRQLCAAMA